MGEILRLMLLLTLCYIYCIKLPKHLIFQQQKSLTSRFYRHNLRHQLFPLYSSTPKAPKPLHVPMCHRLVCPKSQDNRFPDYPILNPLKLAIQLVCKITPITTIKQILLILAISRAIMIGKLCMSWQTYVPTQHSPSKL